MPGSEEQMGLEEAACANAQHLVSGLEWGLMSVGLCVPLEGLIGLYILKIVLSLEGF